MITVDDMMHISELGRSIYTLRVTLKRVKWFIFATNTEQDRNISRCEFLNPKNHRILHFANLFHRTGFKRAHLQELGNNAVADDV